MGWVESQDRISEEVAPGLPICSGPVHICLFLEVTQRPLLGALIAGELRVGAWVTAEQRVKWV